MIFSDVIRNMIIAINAVINNDPNAILIADQVALQMTQWFPLIEGDVEHIYRVWNTQSYEKYKKLNTSEKLLFWKTGGPYQEYIKSKNPKNGISKDLEDQLKNGILISTSNSTNNTPIIIGIIGVTLLGFILLK